MKNKRAIIIIVTTLFFSWVIFTLSEFASEKLNLFEIEPDEFVELNNDGVDKMNDGEYEEGLALFLEALEVYDENDTVFNNLSWAYYSLGDYDLAIEYSEKSIEIEPNTSVEFINYGNALIGIDNYEKAIEMYNNSLDLEDEELYAIYGRGVAYFNTEDYIKAIIDFEHANELEPDDKDTIEYMAVSYLYLGDSEKAIDLLMGIFDETDVEYSLGLFYEVFETSYDYLLAVSTIEKLTEKYPDNKDLEFHLGKVNYLAGKYNNSYALFTKYVSDYPEDFYGYVWSSFSAKSIGEYELAKEWAEKSIDLDSENHEGYNAMAKLYYDQTMYLEASKYYEQVLNMVDDKVDAYFNLIDCLLEAKRYSQGIEIGKAAFDQYPEISDFAGYVGICYTNIGESELAIEYYNKLLEINPYSESAYENIAWEQMYLGEYELALEAANNVLDLNSESQEARNVIAEIELRNEPVLEQIKMAIESYYLYDNYNLDVLNNYSGKVAFSEEEYDDIINSIKLTDDQYTFIIAGEYYDYLKTEDYKTVEYSEIDNETIFVRISEFGLNTDSEFVQMLDSIEKSEEKHLIIDLRSNYGGVTQSANNILDAMLPECVTSYLVYKDGYIHSFYSDASHISFDKISILINGETASASELMTLGLKKYHKNVTIYGQDSVGKGVGQYVYDDAKNKMLLYIVNHYWNVKESNVTVGKIAPDVYVEGNTIEDYLEVIK